MKFSSRSIASVGVAALIAVAGLGVGAGSAFADGPTGNTSSDPVQTYNSNTNTWDGDGAGTVDLSYSTVNGEWTDPDTPDDPNTPDTDESKSKNGTFKVTIPTKISWTNMPVGEVNTNADYEVNVRGAIDADKIVTLTATPSDATSATEGTLKVSSDSFKQTVTHAKTSYTPAEVGLLDTDGKIQGTTVTDNVALSGEANAAGEYVGTIAYEATLA